MRDVLLIDANHEFAVELKEPLRLEDFELHICEDGELALETLEKVFPDLVLLELSLPGMDGYDICRAIRRETDVPLIIVSQRGDVLDKVVALELGADDYIVKPLEVKELIARMKAVLRRSDVQNKIPEKPQSVSGKIVELPGLVIDKGLYSVEVNGQQVEMPPKELELLYFLASNPNRVFTREQLLEDIWGYDFYGESRTVDVHVKRIREKIAKVSSQLPWGIRTVWSVGYKLELIENLEEEAEKIDGT